MLNEDLKKELVSSIKDKLDVKEIILFGSYAWGVPSEDSDIDLAIILDQKGFLKSFTDRVKKTCVVREAIREMNKKYPFDLLLYTNDEWNKLVELDSSFIREINQLGVRLT